SSSTCSSPTTTCATSTAWPHRFRRARPSASSRPSPAADTRCPKRRRPRAVARGLYVDVRGGLEVLHASAALAVVAAGALRLVGNDGLGGEEQRRNRCCVLQRGAGDLGSVDDAELHKV